jgi:hypothetical protein
MSSAAREFKVKVRKGFASKERKISINDTRVSGISWGPCGYQYCGTVTSLAQSAKSGYSRVPSDFIV